MSNPKVKKRDEKRKRKTLRETKMNEAHPTARIMSYSDSLVILVDKKYKFLEI